MLHYTTISDINGRASYFFRDEAKARARAADQNARAEGLGIKARYSVKSCDEDGIEPKEIR